MWVFARVSLLPLALFALEALAQPSGKVPPTLPPRAADKAQEIVQTRTAPTVSLTAPAAGALYTAPVAVVLQATASASSSGKSIMQVEFFASGIAIGTITAAPYTFSWTNVAAGSYSLTARATDNLGATATSAAITVTVNAPPSVSLTGPTSGAVFTAPASVTLSAAAADSDGTVSQVEFFQGSTLLATVTSVPYAFSVNSLPGGAYSFTARATDNRRASVTSAPATVLVNVPPTIALASPTNNATFTAPASITLTAEVADTDGTIAQVEFFNGATPVGTRTAVPYSIVLTEVPQGAYSLSARVTDNQGAVTTSAAVSVTVNSAVAQIYFIHTDHLNTPRLITNNVGQAMWIWGNDDPFGANVPNENPSGLGTFSCNLRMPGQYFDRETSLHYNYFRDYDPAIARYIQFDPIGLRGGINGFAYVGNNPLAKFDPFGLDETIWIPGRGRGIADGPRNGNWCGGNWSGGQVPSLNRGEDGPRGPVDSLDRCCMVHDRCYPQCDRYPDKNIREACLIKCDRGLVSCLRNLNDDCKRWPEPPRAGTESDSQFYRDDALRHFNERIRRWDANNRSR